MTLGLPCITLPTNGRAHCPARGRGRTVGDCDVAPEPILAYSEFYYHTLGADSFFGAEETPTFAHFMRTKTKGAVNLISLDACDRAMTPTHWQHRQHPRAYRDKVSVIHDGIDTTRVR